MGKAGLYREQLRGLPDWEAFLREHSGLPGPRGNLELAEAAADEGDEVLFRRLLTYDADRAPTGTPDEFLAFCGTLGLGKLLAAGRLDVLEELRRLAGDPRWRTREAVAMALQRWGDVDMAALLAAMAGWCQGTLLERRAAVAALCEPRLLARREDVRQVLDLLDQVTQGMVAVVDRRQEPFRVLRQALGYAWSVAAVAWPEEGKARLEAWMAQEDPDVRWVMRENLKKNRLVRMDPGWVGLCRARLGDDARGRPEG